MQAENFTSVLIQYRTIAIFLWADDIQASNVPAHRQPAQQSEDQEHEFDALDSTFNHSGDGIARHLHPTKRRRDSQDSSLSSVAALENIGSNSLHVEDARPAIPIHSKEQLRHSDHSSSWAVSTAQEVSEPSTSGANKQRYQTSISSNEQNSLMLKKSNPSYNLLSPKNLRKRSSKSKKLSPAKIASPRKVSSYANQQRSPNLKSSNKRDYFGKDSDSDPTYIEDVRPSKAKRKRSRHSQHLSPAKVTTSPKSLRSSTGGANSSHSQQNVINLALYFNNLFFLLTNQLNLNVDCLFAELINKMHVLHFIP